MAKLIWSPQAIEDLDAICSYIERDSFEYARLFGERLIALIESIPGQPLLGAVVPEYADERLIAAHSPDGSKANTPGCG